MKYKVVVVTLFALLAIKSGYANTNTELTLAKNFSPILVLTEDIEEPDRRVLKPEPVSIVGAESARNLVFNIGEGIAEVRSFEGWVPSLQNSVQHLGINFAQNNFALLPRSFDYEGIPPGVRQSSQYTVKPRFDYPGTTPALWDSVYFGKGHFADHTKKGSNFDNTAYVHIFDHTIDHRDTSQNGKKVTVIQYFYFYPYNNWWNKHEGDWPRINVIVSNRELSANVLGVEYFFHGASLTYYDSSLLSDLGYPTDSSPEPGLKIDNRPIFDPQVAIRLSQGTHPIVYVSVGSHGSYPTGGRYTLYRPGQLTGNPPDIPNVDSNVYERMTHTGIVLSTQTNNSNSTVPLENYDLVLL